MKLTQHLLALQQEISQQEKALLQDLKMGEERAVAIWYEEYEPVLKKYFQTKLEHPQDVEELTQQTFLHCLKHLPLFRGDSSIKTWMLRIAQHETADFYRKKYAKKALHYLPLHELIENEPISDAHETAAIVKKVMKELSAYYQELLLLKYVDNKTVKEIASEIGKTVKAIESDLFRARREFQRVYLATSYATI